MPSKKPSPTTLPPRLRQNRDRAFWDWTLDLTGVRTESQFITLIKEHFRERVRNGFIRELRIHAGARFWTQFNWELACYFGDIHVRVRDWAGFKGRLPAVAKKLQANFRQLRGECGPEFQVKYDSNPTTGVRHRTFIRYFFLGPKCNLTVPALVKALRIWKANPPLVVLSRTWDGLEFDFGLETREVPRATGLEVWQGSRGLRFVLNANTKRVGRLLTYLTDTGTNNDEEQLRACRRVLEAWSEEDDPEAALPRRWQPLEVYISETFEGVFVEPDDPLDLNTE